MPGAVTCSACPSPIGPKNRSGLCRSCVARRMTQDPEINARRAVSHLAACRSPEWRQRSSKRLKAFFEGNETARQERRERGIRDYHKTIGSEKARSANQVPEVVARRSNAARETRLGWCPVEYRQDYLDLLRKKHIKAIDAKRMILAEIAAKKVPEAPALPMLTSFERAMELVRNGADIIEVRPFNRRADPTYTLGGVSCIDGATG
jgi:hypothetical protein